MSAADNKRIVQDIFAERAKGNGQPFRAAMADDICWHIIGTTQWSGTYRGKEMVMTRLLRPLFAQFADEYTSTAQRIIAEDDIVVVETRGRVTTKRGVPYHNTYCFVMRMAGGQIVDLTEYCDTALVDAALEAPVVEHA
jgi:ketosteroid isomerase-like protein